MRRLYLVLILFFVAAGASYLIARRNHPKLVSVTVYFTDMGRYEAGTPPYEVPVERLVSDKASQPEAVLKAFYQGPAQEERERGLSAITSGTTGFSALTVEDGIARVYLTGPCSSGGATYTVAQPIFKNLLQFPEILHVKIYDAGGKTEEPDGPVNSIPECLEP